MRVAVYYSNSDVRLEERPAPEIGDGELLLRVCASGICGSDLMEWYRRPKAPLVLGHEVAGTVERVGRGVSGFAVGDRIVATHHVPCGSCRYCRSGRESVCPTLHSTRFEPGGFAELVRLPPINVERGVLPLPAGVGFEAGSFVEPLACVIRGQRIAGVAGGDCVAILGSGLSGILHLQLARHCGAQRIVVTDVDASRLEAAKRFGADAALPADLPDLAARLRELNDGRLADRVLVCTDARSAFEQSLELADGGGSILFFAPPAPGQILPVPAHDLWKRGVSIVHSYAGPPAEMRVALELIEQGSIRVDAMVTHRFGLGDTGEGFRITAAGGTGLKVIIDPRM